MLLATDVIFEKLIATFISAYLYHRERYNQKKIFVLADEIIITHGS